MGNLNCFNILPPLPNTILKKKNVKAKKKEKEHKKVMSWLISPLNK